MKGYLTRVPQVIRFTCPFRLGAGSPATEHKASGHRKPLSIRLTSRDAHCQSVKIFNQTGFSPTEIHTANQRFLCSTKANNRRLKQST